MLIVLLLGAILGRVLFPRTETQERRIPVIVTKFDTVRTTWRIVQPAHVTTDTFNLVIKETIHDTVVINVTEHRPALWPVILYEQTSRDTATLRTFDLQSGRGAALKVFTPGPITGLYADSIARPSMNFGTWPSHRISLVNKLIYGSLGYATCKVLN
jgi:hypothetical protein